jgi:hypothetical protein
MKKVLVARTLPIMVFSLSHLAAGQANSINLSLLPLARSSRGFGRYFTDSGRDSGKINFQLLGTYGSVRTPVPGAAWALAVACR